MVGSALRQRKRVAKAPLAAERFFTLSSFISYGYVYYKKQTNRQINKICFCEGIFFVFRAFCIFFDVLYVLYY